MAQRTRLCVTFEMDHHNQEDVTILDMDNNDRRYSYTTTTNSNQSSVDRLCLQDTNVQGESLYSKIFFFSLFIYDEK